MQQVAYCASVACCMLQRELDGTTESVIDRLELSEFEKLERHFSQATPIVLTTTSNAQHAVCKLERLLSQAR